MMVYVQVKPEYREQFIEASKENARNSIQEPGVDRFDLIQGQEDPNSFILVEVYRDDKAPAEHKKTAHYQNWRDTVAEMMAEPRKGVAYSPVYPAVWE
jgi:(4S)-4-hydroxy-5-phosphonooxypentane-2,3-dione isomerase